MRKLFVTWIALFMLAGSVAVSAQSGGEAQQDETKPQEMKKDEMKKDEMKHDEMKEESGKNMKKHK